MQPVVRPQWAATVVAAAARAGRSDSPAGVAARLLTALSRVLAADGGALVLMEPQTGLFSTGAVDRLPVACCHPFFSIELADGPRTFRRLATSGATVSVLPEAHLADDLRDTVLLPHGYGSELRAVCRDAGVVWGGVSLWRAESAPGFDGAAAAVLEQVAPMAGAALRDAVLRSVVGVPGQRAPTDHGVLVVEGRQVIEASEEARGMLREIDDPASMEYRPLDHLLAMAERQPRFSLVVGAHDGRWLTAHGQPLAAGRTAVVLAASSPIELFGSLVAGAGLSAREVEVTRLLCRGLTDTEIAAELCISAHTVHDHVRAVRRKLGVRNRAEVASRIFADHYLDRFLASADVVHAD